VGGSRDGNPVTNFQGIAFNAQVYMGNTLKGDGALFGIPQATQTVGQTIDQNYIANAYRAVAAVPGVPSSARAGAASRTPSSTRRCCRPPAPT
jgi:hypothetical protein